MRPDKELTATEVRRRTKRVRRRAFRYLLLWACTVIFAGWILLPLLFTIWSSFVTPAELSAVPPHWIPHHATTINYRAVLLGQKPTTSGYGTIDVGNQFIVAIKESLIVGVVTTLSNLVIGGAAGYAFARYRFRGSRAGYLFLLISRVVPAIAIITPFYVAFSALGLLNTPWALIISYNVFTLPLSVWLLKSYFEQLPREIEQAAAVDGSSRLQILLRIVVPLARPGLVAAGILIFLEAWSEFFYALVLTNQLTVPPLLVGLQSLEQFSWTTIAAATVIGLIPPIVLVMLFQRFIVSGLARGAVQ